MEQQRFYKGQVILLTSGWFDERGKELVWEAVVGDDGMTILPLVNIDGKGGAYVIMLQQFRQAIGVAIV